MVFSDAWDDFEDARTIWSFFPFSSLAYICGTIFPIRLKHVLKFSGQQGEEKIRETMMNDSTNHSSWFHYTSVGVYASLT